MMLKRYQQKLMSSNGSSLIMLIVLIFVLVTIGSALAFVAISFFKLNRISLASEDLYYKTDRCAQVVQDKLEQRVQEILKNNIDVFDNANTTVSDNAANLILTYYNSLPIADTDITTLKNRLNTKLQTTGGVGADASKAIYDIVFKLYVEDAIKNAGTILGSEDVIKSIITNEIPNSTSTPSDYRLNSITINRQVPARCQTWLSNVINGSGYVYYDDGSTGGNHGLSEPEQVTYGLETENSAAGLTKKIDVKFAVTSIDIDQANYIRTGDSKTIKEFNNSKITTALSKALVSSRDILFKGNKVIEIKGDHGSVYAYGFMPTDMNQTIPVTEHEGGIIFNGANVNISGDAVTRGYILGDSSNANITIGGNAICDSLFIPSKVRYPYGATATAIDLNNITVTGNVSTFDDVRLDAKRSTITIGRDFYGLNEGGLTTTNKSSCLLNNNDHDAVYDNTYPAKITVGGSAFIGGLAYAGNITRNKGTIAVPDIVPFMTGESASIGGNYCLYGYRLPPTGTYSSPPYSFSPTDFRDWTVTGDSTTTASLFDPRLSGGESNREYLKAHFYYYINKRNEAGNALRTIMYNFEPLKKGIILNNDTSSKHYATGIVCAQMYTTSPSSADDGKYYWLNGALPWGSNSPPADFGETTNLPWNHTDYQQMISLLNSTSKKTAAINEISFIRAYNDTAADPNLAHNKEKEFTDYSGFLDKPEGNSEGNPAGSSGYFYEGGGGSSDNYYYYVTNKDTTLTIGNVSHDPANGNIPQSYINGKTVILYTKGQIKIQPSSDLTFNGIIIANAASSDSIPAASGDIGSGSITLDSTQGKITITNDNSTLYHMYNNASPDLRKFFAPANTLGTGTGAQIQTEDVYRNSNRNVMMIDKKLVKNY